MYIVTNNRPYYPDIEYFESLEEAKAARDKWIRENHEESGDHTVKVTLAEVIETTEVKTDW
jgi:hypothetical protein